MKNVLVTGGARGIGAGIVEKMAKEKWNVAFCARGDESEYVERCQELEKKYAIKALYIKCDVACREQRKAMIEKVLEEFGTINALVNNAGVAPNVRDDILNATEESYDRVMNINLKGPYFLTQLVANHMVEQKEKDPNFTAYIVNIGSCSSTIASVNRGEYCISKAGTAMTTKLWAVRLGEIGIPVYEIRPGVIATDMTAGVTERYDKLIADGLTVQPRWGYPEDIAKAVAMLLRGDLPYSTGQVIDVTGGMEIGRL